MNGTATLLEPARPRPREGRVACDRRAIAIGAALLVIAVAAISNLSPRWLAAAGIALALFFALKLLTLCGYDARTTHVTRVFGYLVCWPGMNARTFLPVARPAPLAPSLTELAAALLKLALGIALAGWAKLHVLDARPMLVGWVGMLGVIFIFHFGLFHVLSWMWRRAGVDAPPLMRAPIASCSLAEFWSARWNTAFAETARRFVFRPLGRRIGSALAITAVFLISGLVHELAISLPANGGWGGPTLYFLLQVSGLAAERSAAGRRFGLGARLRGWLWMVLFTAAPLPLLFHVPLIEKVILPFFQFLEAL